MTGLEAIIVAIVLGWGFNEAVTDDRPVCQVVEVHNEQQVLVPKFCADVLPH